MPREIEVEENAKGKKKKNKVPIQVQKQVGAKNCHFPGNISQDELEERKAMLISRTVV